MIRGIGSEKRRGWSRGDLVSMWDKPTVSLSCNREKVYVDGERVAKMGIV